ncbi:MAG: hypothetical protein QOJ35_3151 [Solirubrobacteraceae bacterium]|jgi:signal transduction histidine kinase|nr:hypothetical protein [Solirubrobacteraceae bacterium]
MSATTSGRPRRFSAGPIDVVVTVLVALVALGVAIDDATRHDRLWVVAVAAATIAPLIVRQRWPLVALAAILAAGLGLPPGVLVELPAAVVVYAIAARGGWRPAAVASVAVVLARIAETLLWGDAPSLDDVVSPALMCAAAVAYGLYLGARRVTMDALVERAERLDRERELLAERAVAQERIRIAQELHDVVAHTVSLIVVQAQALGATAGSEAVMRATDAIADLGRQAMTEMHRTLELLRAPDESADRAPQPGLAGLAALIEQSRAAGVDVTLSVEGEPRPLAQALDLSAYRIVQESLTNVLKHAGPTEAQVTVAYGPDALALTIADSGGGAAPKAKANGHPGGHGLVGMRERAALFGGTISAQPRAGRGFEVAAVLPYPRA